MKDFEHRIRDRDITLFGVPKPVPDVTWATFVMPLFTLFLFISGLAVLSTIHFREKIEAQARTFLAVPISGSFTHKVVRASFIWDSFEIRGIQYFPKDAQDPVRIKRVIVSEIGRKFLFKVARNGLLVPDKFKLGIVGLQTSVSNFPPETAQFLRELGYESVYLSLSAEVIMSRASERMELRKVVADVSDAGRFVFTMTLDHISIPRDMDSIASVFQFSKLLESPEWQSALVTSLDFEFRNQTLTNRLAQRSRDRGEDGPFAWMGIGPRTVASGSIDFTSLTARKLSQLTEGRGIRIRMEPSTPVPVSEFSFSEFRDLNSAQKKFGLSHLE